MARNSTKEKAYAAELGKSHVDLSAEERMAANDGEWEAELRRVAADEGSDIEVGQNFDRILVIPPYVQRKADEYGLSLRWTLLDPADNGRDLQLAHYLGWEPAVGRDGEYIYSGRRNKMQLFWISEKKRDKYKKKEADRFATKQRPDETGMFGSTRTRRGDTTHDHRVGG